MLKKLRENKLLKFLFKAIKVIVTLLIILVVALIVIQRVFNNKVSVGGYRIFTIITESMVPEYKVNDVIISKEIDASEIKIGDDVVYLGKEDTFKDKIITHRVIEIDDSESIRKFTTQGIANTGVDPEIDETQIYGVVIGKSVILSTISKLVNNSIGFYFLILVPAVFLIFLEIIDFIKDKKEEDNDDSGQEEEA